MKAVAEGYDRCVVALIHAGADVNIIDNTEQTALHWATCYGHDKCVQLLLDAAVDMNSKDKDGVTALLLAAHEGQDTCLEVLIKAGADVNVANDMNRQPYIGWLFLAMISVLNCCLIQAQK